MKRLIEKNKTTGTKEKRSIRGKIKGTPERPRLTVFKSNKNIYIQVIDDISATTLVSASNLEKDLKDVKSNVEGAEKLGTVIGERLKEKKSKLLYSTETVFISR